MDTDNMPGKIREAFQGTRGRVLLVAGAGIIGYVWWTRGRHAGATADPAGIQNAFDAGLATGGGGQSAPTVGNDTQVATGNTGRPKSNDEWLARGVDYLGAGITGYDALRKALDGKPLTTAEESMVSRVITFLGAPPEGMPPRGATAPAPTVTLKAPTGLRVTGVTATTVSLAWSAVAGAQYYRAYRAGVSGNVGASDGPAITVGGLRPATTYKFAVAADTTTHKPGPKSSYVTAKTKAK